MKGAGTVMLRPGRRCLLSGRFHSAWAGFFDLTGPGFLSLKTAR